MIYITGDTYGDFSRFSKLSLTDEDLIIVLGDVGVNYNMDPHDTIAKKRLSKLPCRFFFIRGNHEERPEKIEGYKLSRVEGIVTGNVYVQKKYPRLMFASDGEYELGGRRCFVVNGAYSVDKYYRLERGMKWFEDEELTDDEMEYVMEIALSTKSVDHILSHTCPVKYMPVDTFLPFVNQSSVSKRMEEFLDKIEMILGYQKW